MNRVFHSRIPNEMQHDVNISIVHKQSSIVLFIYVVSCSTKQEKKSPRKSARHRFDTFDNECKTIFYLDTTSKEHLFSRLVFIDDRSRTRTCSIEDEKSCTHDTIRQQTTNATYSCSSMNIGQLDGR
jgi:hypothetical protein